MPAADPPLFANTNPHPQKLPIASIFIADKVSPAVSSPKGGELRIIYAGPDDAKVVEPSEVLELGADLDPPPRGGADPPP